MTRGQRRTDRSDSTGRSRLRNGVNSIRYIPRGTLRMSTRESGDGYDEVPMTGWKGIVCGPVEGSKEGL